MIETTAMSRKNYYKLLEIKPDADAKEIKRAYRRMVRLYHPDTGTSSIVSPERFQEIVEAYQVLRDPEKRAQYDRILNRPPVRVIESDWRHKPPKQKPSPPPPREQARPKAKPYQYERRPLYEAYEPAPKTRWQRIKPYVTLPLLLLVASVVLLGVMQITENVIRPATRSRLSTQGIVDNVQTYNCGQPTFCYYVTYKYAVNGRTYSGSFSSNNGPFYVGSGVPLRYYLNNPADSVISTGEEEKPNIMPYLILVGSVIIMGSAGWILSERISLQNMKKQDGSWQRWG